MPAYLRNPQKALKIDSRGLKMILQEILNILSLSSYEVTVSIVSNKKIQQLNRHFRMKDYPTDVLSFPYLEADEILSPVNTEKILGDIVISAEKAGEQAAELGQSLKEELAFLMIHGVLHLTGMDHIKKSDEKIMLAKQQEVRSALIKKGFF